MSEPTDGGVQAFSSSVGLDTPLNDVDLNPIRGQAVVAIICAECGHAPIGKVLVAGSTVWLNRYGAPHTEDYPVRRAAQGTSRIPAPRIVLTARLQGAGYPARSVWCEKHGPKTVEAAAIFSAIQRGRDSGKLVRLAV